jgi:hypothetical protein
MIKGDVTINSNIKPRGTKRIRMYRSKIRDFNFLSRSMRCLFTGSPRFFRIWPGPVFSGVFGWTPSENGVEAKKD